MENLMTDWVVEYIKGVPHVVQKDPKTGKTTEIGGQFDNEEEAQEVADTRNNPKQPDLETPRRDAIESAYPELLLGGAGSAVGKGIGTLGKYALPYIQRALSRLAAPAAVTTAGTKTGGGKDTPVPPITIVPPIIRSLSRATDKAETKAETEVDKGYELMGSFTMPGGSMSESIKTYINPITGDLHEGVARAALKEPGYAQMVREQLFGEGDSGLIPMGGREGGLEKALMPREIKALGERNLLDPNTQHRDQETRLHTDYTAQLAKLIQQMAVTRGESDLADYTQDEIGYIGGHHDKGKLPLGPFMLNPEMAAHNMNIPFPTFANDEGKRHANNLIDLSRVGHNVSGKQLVESWGTKITPEVASVIKEHHKPFTQMTSPLNRLIAAADIAAATGGRPRDYQVIKDYNSLRSNPDLAANAEELGMRLNPDPGQTPLVYYTPEHRLKNAASVMDRMNKSPTPTSLAPSMYDAYTALTNDPLSKQKLLEALKLQMGPLLDPRRDAEIKEPELPWN
jgi:hypothetical protein